MGPGLIEIANVVGEHCEQMALAQDDDVIETLPAYAAEEALTGGIHIWRAHGGLDDPRSEGLGSEIEFGAELAVPIADDELGPDAERRSIAELLRRPLLGGSPCRRDVHDFARPDIDDEKGEDWPKPDVVGLDEVARPDVPGVVFEERCPPLTGRARLHTPLEIFLDRALRDTDAELEQFATDALRAPKAIFAGHATDELDRVDRNAGPRFLMSRPPAPEHLKSLPMPAQDRLGLHQKHRFAPSAGDRA